VAGLESSAALWRRSYSEGGEKRFSLKNREEQGMHSETQRERERERESMRSH